MAAVFKCTKITNFGTSPVSPSQQVVKADYINPTIPSPPTLTVTLSLPTVDAVNPEELMAAIDAAVAIASTDTINWEL